MQRATWIVGILGILLVGCPVGSGRTHSKAQVNTRIVGGEEADDQEFPFAALLTTVSGGESHTCGASLLTKEYVITAAHCVTDSGVTVSPRSVSIGMGSNDKDDLDAYQVGRIYVHPDFDYQQVENDIALLKLRSLVDLGDNIKTIQIYDKSTKDGDKYTAIGWGRTKGDKKELSDDLRKVQITLGPTKDCVSANPFFYDQGGGQLCAADNDGHDTCQGDSGGPLLYEKRSDKDDDSDSDSKYLLVGLTSYGYTPGSSKVECGTKSVVAFYTNVTHYLDWISEVTDKSESDLASKQSKEDGEDDNGGEDEASDGDDDDGQEEKNYAKIRTDKSVVTTTVLSDNATIFGALPSNVSDDSAAVFSKPYSIAVLGSQLVALAVLQAGAAL
ncbi:Serine protease 55 [Dispira simplex]|nr:Serine protease 55 [Dispira simplex]